jgi:CYTH domain-containing protein
MLELERTYLARFLPDDLAQASHREIIDIYFPEVSRHPVMRLRKNGDVFEITKKKPVGSDKSTQHEQTISLDSAEFAALAKLPGKHVAKERYEYKVGEYTAEFDVFTEALTGLVVIDFEFNSEIEKEHFVAPDFCLAEVTQDTFIAGGMLAGASFSDIEEDLASFGYRPLTM